MTKIKTEFLQEQMVLAEDVCDKSGRRLALKGTLLSKHHRLVFRTWGITEVEILDNAEHGKTAPLRNDPPLPTEPAEEALEELRSWFHLNNHQHPFIHELLNIAARRQALQNDR